MMMPLLPLSRATQGHRDHGIEEEGGGGQCCKDQGQTARQAATALPMMAVSASVASFDRWWDLCRNFTFVWCDIEGYRVAIQK